MMRRSYLLFNYTMGQQTTKINAAECLHYFKAVRDVAQCSKTTAIDFYASLRKTFTAKSTSSVLPAYM